MGGTDKTDTRLYLVCGPVGGDLIFQSQAYPSNGIYVRRGGQLATVFTTANRAADSDFLVNLQAMDIREDGTIYRLALNEFDEMELYEATPQVKRHRAWPSVTSPVKSRRGPYRSFLLC